MENENSKNNSKTSEKSFANNINKAIRNLSPNQKEYNVIKFGEFATEARKEDENQKGHSSIDLYNKQGRLFTSFENIDGKDSSVNYNFDYYKNFVIVDKSTNNNGKNQHNEQYFINYDGKRITTGLNDEKIPVLFREKSDKFLVLSNCAVICDETKWFALYSTKENKIVFNTNDLKNEIKDYINSDRTKLYVDTQDKNTLRYNIKTTKGIFSKNWLVKVDLVNGEILLNNEYLKKLKRKNKVQTMHGINETSTNDNDNELSM